MSPIASIVFVTAEGEIMSMSTRLYGRANDFINRGNMQDARRILMKLLALEPDNPAFWQSYQETQPTIGEYQVVLRSLARRHPGDKQVERRIARLQSQKIAQQMPETAVRSRKTVPLLFLANVTVILCMLSAFFWFVMEPSRTAVQKLQIEYDTLLADYNDLVIKYNHLTNDYGLLATSHQQLSGGYEQLQVENNALLGKYNQLNHDHILLQKDLERTLADFNNLTVQYDNLQSRYNQLSAVYNSLETDYTTLQGNYNGLVKDYNALAARAIEPPYIYVQGRQVHIAFIRTNGELARWQVSFDDLEKSIRQGYRARENPLQFIMGSITLKNDNGDQMRVTDYRAFVDAEPFRTVVPDLYYTSASDNAFVYELWHIATQLTSYSPEIQDTPRYPLETLLAGGGDCEDTAILVASMLKAAPVSWDINLVYMDLYNPGSQKTANHLIVHVNTGVEEYFIETTSAWDMEPNRYVAGWYLPIGNDQGRFSLEQ